MSNDNQKLAELLALRPLSAGEMSFPEFLKSLKEHPERADTAAALLVRTIKANGQVDINQSSAQRRPYLRMLKSLGLPNFKAFEHIRGSQRLVARIVKFLESAAQNGYQLRQMITLVGGPGSGKSFLADAFKSSLEGQIVYAVKGCPVNENPVNLLKLLTPEQVTRLSAELELGNLLTELLKVAGDPCAHCWQLAMKESTPGLSNIPVDALRLSSRHSGISTWMPSAQGQGCSLVHALRQGSRGISDLPEAFSVSESVPGQAHELDVLLEATEGRRIPTGDESCSKTSGYQPLDEVIIAQSNDGAYKRYLDSQPDPNRFTRRNQILPVRYNTVRSEEVQAYLDFIDVLKVKPHLDPLTLSVAATLAIYSRLKRDGEIELEKRMRIYDGERIPILRKQSSLQKRTDPYSIIATSTLANPANGRDASPETSKLISVLDLWENADDEALVGLNMGLMLSMISQTCELACNHKRQCLTALDMLHYLRARISAELDTPELTSADKNMLTSCADFLKETRSNEPCLIEKEYRRLLVGQVLYVFRPDYEDEANRIFERYRAHARASASGQKLVFDRYFNKEVPVDLEFLESLEKSMGKTIASEQDKFRRSLESEFTHILTRQVSQAEDSGVSVTINWRTLPDLQKAIAHHLNADIAKDVQRLLTQEIDLSDDDRKVRSESLERFRALGYCDNCLGLALEYFKGFELWTSIEEKA